MDASLSGPLGASSSKRVSGARLRTLLLHNPKAGDGTPDAETLSAALAQSGCDVFHCTKQDKGLAEALARGWDLIVTAGGDGTVGKVVRRLTVRSIPLVIQPMGTSNNIARSLGVSARPEDLAAGLLTAGFRDLDTGFAIGPWGRRRFVEAVGIGAVAEAIENAAPKSALEDRIRKGRKELRRTLAKAKPHCVALRIDGQEIEGEFLFVEVLNLCFSGPRLPFAHRAEAGDSLLDVLFLDESNRTDVLDWIKDATELEPPPLKLVQGRAVEIVWKDAPLRIDDRVYTPPKKGATVEIGLEADALSVLIPKSGAVPR